MTTKVLWFSRHSLDNDQIDGLKSVYGEIEVEQINRTIQNARELHNEIERNDVIAIVAPIQLQQEFLREAHGKPVITAVSDRVLIPQEDGSESKVQFRFNRWEQIDKIEVVTHTLANMADVERFRKKN